MSETGRGSGGERLADLPVGASGEVLGFCGCKRRAQRLAELGMSPGIRIEVLRAAPGQPMLLRVRRTLLALDRQSAADVLVRPVGRADERPCRGGRRRSGRRWFHHRRQRGGH